MSHPFGDLLSQHLHRKHGLSQARLAAGILQAPPVISDMCNGRRLSGPQARERVIAIIGWLHQQGALDKLDEANALLNVAGMAPLNERAAAEATLTQALCPPDMLRPSLAPSRSTPNGAARHNLPAQLTSFIGREGDIAEITAHLKTVRLLTLTGAGGIGKTRLALEVAKNLLDDFADGLWLVELAPLSDPALVPQAIATAFKLPEQPGRTHLDVLIGYLETKYVLLILDNCEHLIEACAQLAEPLLRNCQNVHLLATSRELLHIAGEVNWRVPSLTTPDTVDASLAPDHVRVREWASARPAPTTATELLEYESVRLFVERARAIRPDFDLTDHNAAAVARICQQLDGIPLAIELAATRLNALSPEQITERLNDRFNLLISHNRAVIQRHQTLHATIAWSFDLLTLTERDLLARLSVFAGGFTTEAAEAIFEHPDTFDLLSNLVDKSLVIADVRGDAARFRLLETIREFAQDLLRETGTEGAARDRHLAYFLKLAEVAEIGMRSEKLHDWSTQLDQDLDNLRAALAWSYEAGKFEMGLRLAGALWLFWCVGDRAHEGLAWVDKLLKASAGAPAPASVRAKALYGAAMMAWRTEERLRMVTFVENGLSLSEESKDAIGVALSLICLGLLTEVELNYQRARAMFEEALGLLRTAQHLWGVGLVKLNLGKSLMVQGDFAQGEAALVDDLSLFRTLDWWFLSDALYTLVGAALAQGDLTRAKALAQQRLTLGREDGQIRMCCRALRELGNIALQEGDYRRATELLEECIALFRKAGHSEPNITHALTDLGFVSLLQGDYEKATQRFNEARDFYQAIGNNFSLGHVQVCLGYTSLARGDSASAHMHFQEGVKLNHRVGYMGGIAIGLTGIGWVSQAQGHVQRAVKLCGFAAKFSGIVSIYWLPAERADYERILADIRARLDDPKLAAAWAEGQAMTREQAVEYALEDDSTQRMGNE